MGDPGVGFRYVIHNLPIAFKAQKPPNCDVKLSALLRTVPDSPGKCDAEFELSGRWVEGLVPNRGQTVNAALASPWHITGSTIRCRAGRFSRETDDDHVSEVSPK